MRGKTLVCRCEDVTLDDVEDALRKGYRDIESVKRYTGLSTGWCEGRGCLVHCARLVAGAGSPIEIQPTTPRPPLRATPLAILATLPEDP